MKKNKEHPLLEVKQLKTCFSTTYGLVPIVDGVSFHINRGETVAVVGESGCGKSVTSLSIMGLLPKLAKIEKGEILFEGKDLGKASKKEMREIRGNEISMIFQEPLTSLNPLFTIGNQLSEVIRLHEKVSKNEARKKGIDILTRVGIARAEKMYSTYPHLLSGGMRQRVMIAMALACNPKLLIADEPTTALDVTIQAQILQLMRQLSQEFGTSIMLITHDLGVVAEMADRVIVMYAGQVVEQGDVYSLFQNPKHPYTKSLLKSTPNIDQSNETLEPIEGTVPSPMEMPKGCRFHPRCPCKLEKCASESPQMYPLSREHDVRCWLFDGPSEVAI
ncbi:ABC transporter ATP-binding protein [Brevibacillus sp. B_LB10_24]|uniref:ABC transporter ATP-binding protein n=1 Tax=Brevibacillus sp. B_LB10_24 TaxID=3380645 RepID=UPI0038BB2F71